MNMKQYFFVALLCSLFALSGCESSAEDDVVVRMKFQDNLSLRPMKVIYRSDRCWSLNFTASGKPYRKADYTGVELTPQRKGAEGEYEARFPVDRGGLCQWRLNSVMFGVTYKIAASLEDSVELGSGGGMIVIFDNHGGPRGSADFEASGNINIKKDYYPWLFEDFHGGLKKIILLGQGDIYLTYKAPQAREIYFEPVLHSQYVVRSIEPERSEKGKYLTFIYPDGSRVTEGQITPSFEMLQCIRLPTTCEQ
ncbi:hypothetical protein ACIP1T_25965 [Pseudomonas japonica]|uniref:hypothetical protein n=1 Tax=Pseudomonas japonica TaxID=256466 RepID=UPI003822EAAD